MTVDVRKSHKTPPQPKDFVKSVYTIQFGQEEQRWVAILKVFAHSFRSFGTPLNATP